MPAAAEVQRDPLLGADGEHRLNVGAVAGPHDGARDRPVGACVGRVCDEVDRASTHLPLSDGELEPAAQRGGRALRDPGRGAVGRRRPGGPADSLDVGRERPAHQARTIPGATSTCTRDGPSSASASPSPTRSSSRPTTVRDWTP